jgi:hypothetical protein
VVTEFVVVGARPLDVADAFTGTAAVDPDYGLRSVLDEGATQVVDTEGETLVTVFRSRGIEVPSEILRLTGRIEAGWLFWTEAFVPDGPASRSAAGRAVLDSIAAQAATVLQPL